MSKKFERKTNNNSIFGINAINDALRFSDIVEQVYICKDIDTSRNKGVGKIVSLANHKNINIKFVDREMLNSDACGQIHQGVMAKIRPFKYADIDDVIATDKNGDDKPDLIIVLDHIKDAGNLGAIIRSAEAVGASCVVIPNRRGADIEPSTYKTSAGAIVNMPIVKIANISAILEKLKDAGYWVCAASEHAEQEIWDCNLSGKLAIVMGGEHEGVSPLVLKNSDFSAKMPIIGKVQSLNVAQACSVFCYEWVRQNRQSNNNGVTE